MISLDKRFSHLYIEQAVWDHPDVQRIRELFPKAVCIPISRYTDVFNRSRQSYEDQYARQNLILAEKHGTFLYEGAPVCHDFGNRRFFYTAMAINCLYNCEYCWLKGMYNSANLVLFVNLEDAFQETEQRLEEGPMYLSLSFESDLVPLEPFTHQITRWNAFVHQHAGLTAEIRTKCGSTAIYETLEASDRFITAFTLSPQVLIDAMEHGTSSLAQRLDAVNAAMRNGFPVRICFDPMIRIPDWKTAYEELIHTVTDKVDLSAVKDFSIGTYRQSDTYQRRMRRRFPASAVLQYPYETKNGYCQYPEPEKTEMEQFLKHALLQYVREEQIYLLEDNV